MDTEDRRGHNQPPLSNDRYSRIAVWILFWATIAFLIATLVFGFDADIPIFDP